MDTLATQILRLYKQNPIAPIFAFFSYNKNYNTGASGIAVSAVQSSMWLAGNSFINSIDELIKLPNFLAIK